jgi:hypothetical protein
MQDTSARKRARKLYYYTSLFRAGANFSIKLIKEYKKTLEKYLPLLERLEINFTYLSIFMSAFSILLNIIKMLHGAWATQLTANKAERATNVMMGGVNIALAIINITLQALLVGGISFAIITATPLLLIIGAVRAFIENGCKTAASIYDRFYGDKGIEYSHCIKEHINKIQLTQPELQKLKESYNAQIELNNKISERAEGTLIAATALVAGIFLAIPPLAPAGIIILSSLFVYGVLNAFKINPIKWLAFGIHKLASYLTDGKSLRYNIFYELNDKELLKRYPIGIIKEKPAAVKIPEPAKPVKDKTSTPSFPLVIPIDCKTKERRDVTRCASWTPSIFTTYLPLKPISNDHSNTKKVTFKYN